MISEVIILIIKARTNLILCLHSIISGLSSEQKKKLKIKILDFLEIKMVQASLKAKINKKKMLVDLILTISKKVNNKIYLKLINLTLLTDSVNKMQKLLKKKIKLKVQNQYSNWIKM